MADPAIETVPTSTEVKSPAAEVVVAGVEAAEVLAVAAALLAVVVAVLVAAVDAGVDAAADVLAAVEVVIADVDVAVVAVVAGVAGVVAVVVELVVDSAVTAEPSKLTESNTAVVSSPALWLVTASPTLTVCPRVTVAMPTVVQVTPSADVAAVKVLPVRASCTQ